ncbi:hypothetical protein SBBP2_420009 [Burkholderiales bacterium]|nr:hypothetical protein SBBP2_420009 [Burkholderiales bacterium]
MTHSRENGRRAVVDLSENFMPYSGRLSGLKVRIRRLYSGRGPAPTLGLSLQHCDE